MFNTMTITKALGATCASLLVFLLATWAADSLYYTGGAYGGEEAQQAYVIDTGTEDVAPAEEVVAVDFAVLVAAADVPAGEKVFAKCKACHKIDGSDGTGPHLNGIVGKAKAASAGFAYSATLKGMAADAWTSDNLNAFLANPKGYAPGNRMAFAGLPKVEDRANLVAWLATTTP
jgi:cytochrome c